MPAAKDITGQKFSWLTAIERRDKTKGGNYKWLFRCDCGNELIIASGNVISGHSRSCGCVFGYSNVHHMAKTHFYHKWEGMKARCTNPSNISYERYGKKGVTVCERWHTFQNFMNDMHETYLRHCEVFGKRNTTLDRKDNLKGYSPDNCRWATIAEQNNNRSFNRIIEYRGEKDTLCNMSRKYGYEYHVIKYRLNNGWDLERAFTTPLRKTKKTSLK